MFATWALVSLLAASSPSAQSAGDKAIVGAWSCRSGPCIDPEIEFAVEDGERVFHSWLHQRPGSFGKWSVKGRTLTLVIAGRVFEYRIIRAGQRELVLRDKTDSANARYRRIVE